MRPVNSPTRTAHDWRIAAAGAVVVVAGLLAYCNTLDVPFLLDDWVRIENNPAIRRLWPVRVPMSNTNRPLGVYTLAINYALDGYRVWGYHAVNLAIHLAAGLLLLGVVRRTLAEGRRAELYRSASLPLALTIALAWVVHPLQTQAVTYIVQRLESLMGLCYLATLYVVRAPSSRRPGWWYAVGIFCCGLGMGTKEVMVTAPLVVLWYDRVFVAESWRAIASSRRWFYLGLAGTWGVLAWAMLHWHGDYGSGDVGTIDGLTPLSYLLSQAGVLVRYLRLCVWPSGQCFDYAWPVARAAGEIVAPLLAISSLLAVTLWCMLRRPAWGFLGGCFFLILAPTSSIVPVRDLAVEHRMYLASAAVIAAILLAAYAGLETFARRVRLGGRGRAVGQLCLAGGVAVALGVLTFHRNDTYASGVSIWQDTVEKAPANARAYCNLGDALCKAGRYDESIVAFLRAVELQADFALAEHNLGIACHKAGRHDESTAHLLRAIELKSDYDQAYYHLGTFQCERGDYLDATGNFAAAVEIEYRNGKYLNSYGTALYTLGQYDSAVAHLTRAAKIIPADAGVHYNLANALLAVRRFDGAIDHYQTTLEIDSDYSMAPFVHSGLGSALEARGELELAITEYREAVALKPDQASFRFSLARAHERQGSVGEAVAEYRELLELEPGNPAAMRALRRALDGLPPQSAGAGK